MDMFVILIAVVAGLFVSVKLVPRLDAIVSFLQVIMMVLWHAIWLMLLLITAAALLSFKNIGFGFSGLSLITAVIGLILTVSIWGKLQVQRGVS
ncbi:MAG: hypothetical protein GY796_03735 [Chloroflexi bacterium]|nr:hypothetical protein [Chloroflexota bacterium]